MMTVVLTSHYVVLIHLVLLFLGIDFEEEEKRVKGCSSLVPVSLTVFAPG